LENLFGNQLNPGKELIEDPLAPYKPAEKNKNLTLKDLFRL